MRPDVDTASARFNDGREIEADVIIGADGIHSAVRASLFGPDAPRFTGKICYRSVIPADAVPRDAHRQENATWLGPHGAVVIYGVRRGELINVVAHYDDETYTHESWIAQCEREEILQRFRGWNEALARVFGASEVWYKWALYDRDPIPRWTSGRVAVLGDAAHPMLPYLGQGACQAMEDGCVLAAALGSMPDDFPAALSLYERSRRPRASRVVLAARARGEDNHLASPMSAWRRDLRIALRKRFRSDREGRGAAWIADYDAGSPSALAPWMPAPAAFGRGVRVLHSKCQYVYSEKRRVLDIPHGTRYLEIEAWVESRFQGGVVPKSFGPRVPRTRRSSDRAGAPQPRQP